MLKSFLTVTLCVVTWFSFAQTTQHSPVTSIKENSDYTIISPRHPVPQKSHKIKVLEFFSYQCVHCAALEPSLAKWIALHKEIEFIPIQVVWGDYFRNYAKINATSTLLGLQSDFTQQVFAATMAGANLEDMQELKKFLQNNSKLVDQQNFINTYNSFTLTLIPAQYAQYTIDYAITGTPSFVVADKYLTLPAPPPRLLIVLDALVAKASTNLKHAQ
jgi:protein dithiol oxidoreductase (disulfide-forming)